MRQTRIAACVVAVFLVGTAAWAQQTIGLFVNDPQAFQGYTLIAPLSAKTAYLINNDGLVVHSWTGSNVQFIAYFRENGHLLRAVQIAVPSNFSGSAGGGGRIEEVDWDGTIVWSYDIADNSQFAHHDIEPMPNGNVLVNVWRYHTNAEAIAAGHNPGTLGGAIWSDSIYELQPNPPGATVVWQWHVWDHLVQDFDPTKANYGVVADHPELVDLNFGTLVNTADWNHANCVKYNADLDQVVWSSRVFSEFYVVDHSTTTAQAAGHTGGRSGKGGDILYRWGNPLAYRRGIAGDQRLFSQHDAQWIPPGHPGAGHFMAFNNGNNRPGPDFSSSDEITGPTPDSNGNYAIAPGQPWAPSAASWTYSDPVPASFFAGFISGTQRQPNGNTLVIHGPDGIIREVLSNGTIVWRYVVPVDGLAPETQGTVPAVNDTFKARRYAPDFPGFIGKTLTPGDPIEVFNRPYPVSGASLRAAKVSPTGDQINVSWTASCATNNYNLLYGAMGSVSSATLMGARCSIGTTGTYAWTSVPGQSLFYVVVGRDSSGLYESSWGLNGSGGQRGGTRASFLCGTTTKIVTSTCP